MTSGEIEAIYVKLLEYSENPANKLGTFSEF